MQRTMLAALTALSIATVSMTMPVAAQISADYFPNLPVTDQEGRALKFYDDLIKNKMVIISFIYTSCTDICPLTTARMTQLEDKLGNLVGRDFFIISMTVDPENDTPEKLKAYAKAYGTGPGWTFVTGSPENIRAINYKLGDRSRQLSEHRNEIVLGNAATGEWQRDNVFGDLDRVVMTVRAMDPKWRDQVHEATRTNAMNTGIALGNQPGQAMFKKACAGCHTIGVGDRAGPDLRGVTERRDRAWLTSFIKSPSAMRAKHDPLAMELMDKYKPVVMPNIGISDADAGDLISYLTEETAKLVEAQVPMPVRSHDHSQHQHQH
jgi:protein SCO1/2